MEKEKIEQKKEMRCGYAEQSIPELKKEGWEYEWSFHAKIPEQWNYACDRVGSLQRNGDWKAILVKGQTEEEIKDTVTYIYKRKTSQRKEWDKEKGY